MKSEKYLHSLEKFGINLGLDRIIYLMDKLGNPHLKFKSIHVAGTNGKGSTCAMSASILKEAGYKVGLYTSPHLFDYRERIKINGKDISKKDFNEGLGRIRREAKGLGGKPTVFEVLTAVAFWYFAKKKVDYAVVEVGLGGRLDATNVVTPLVSVITNIDYEHTAVLGKTLTKIAAEKAAIIKPGAPCVTAENKGEPLRVIEKTCRAKNSALVEVRKGVMGSEKWDRKWEVGSGLVGFHQGLNAACALSAILLSGIKVGKSAIKRGLKGVRWPGRFQVISRRPLIIVDGAHNPAGIKALVAALKSLYVQTKFVVIFGCQKDKDYKKMLRGIKPVASKIIITRSSHKEAAKLKDSVSFKQALGRWDTENPLLIAGSLFLVADALQRFAKKSKFS